MSTPTTHRARKFAFRFASLLLAFSTTLAVADDGQPTPQFAAAVKEWAHAGPVRLYEQASPAVVGITCHDAKGLQYFGTGTVIDARGMVLTSTTVAPPEAEEIRVYLQGGRVLSAKLLEADPTTEFALLDIEAADENQRFPTVRLGSSANARLGHAVYTLGNAFASIQRDDQVAMAAGVVSGLYELADARSQATYRGPVIETTAPVNGGMDGGPLLDTEGRLLGVLGLNYSPNRWLGTAVPVDELKPLLARHRAWFRDDRSQPVFLGLELEEVAGERVRIVAVQANSPAERGGLRPGSIILEVDGEPMKKLEHFRARLEEHRQGASFVFTVQTKGKVEKREVAPWIRL